MIPTIKIMSVIAFVSVCLVLRLYRLFKTIQVDENSVKSKNKYKVHDVIDVQIGLVIETAIISAVIIDEKYGSVCYVGRNEKGECFYFDERSVIENDK